MNGPENRRLTAKRVMDIRGTRQLDDKAGARIGLSKNQPDHFVDTSRPAGEKQPG
jgi:hypothetical protein